MLFDDLLCVFLLVLFVLICVLLLVFELPTPYGKHYSGSTGVPPTWAWILQESPNLLWVIHYSISRCYQSTILFTLFAAHYTHRTVLYPLLAKSSKPVPLVTVIAAALFTTANGYLQMNHIAHKHCSAPTNYTLFHIGLAVFLAGAFINIKSDAILRNLRPERSAEYKIPRGFLFEYVSCANLFGEIVEWFGFALSSGSLPGWTFMVCTLCNLLPRALSSHRWYKTRFGGSYPEHRRALVPFVL